MRVDHGGGHIVVPEQLLNSADISSTLQQMRSEGMAKGMGADLLRQPCTAHRHLDGFVDDARVNMMATREARARVNGEIPGRKDILPAPFLGGSGVFPRQRMRKVHRRHAREPDLADVAF